MTQKVYFARCIASNGADMEAIKIGCSIGVPGRLAAVAANVPFDCEFIADAPGGLFAEYAVHMWLRADRMAGEYFKASPRVLAFVDKVFETGKLPLRIKDGGDGPWITMAGAREFMVRHGLSVADISAVSGTSIKSCQLHLDRADRPNRKFAAALTVAALERGHSVNWPKDFRARTPTSQDDRVGAA